jgi:AraC family transcriptional regulator of adaptative response / DNA-3-methyladenine glycosylase II
VAASRRTLVKTCGLGERLATGVVMRGLCWPEAFPTSDPALQRAAGASGAVALRALAERWRPWRSWRSYAALHLWYRSPLVARR